MYSPNWHLYTELFLWFCTCSVSQISTFKSGFRSLFDRVTITSHSSMLHHKRSYYIDMFNSTQKHHNMDISRHNPSTGCDNLEWKWDACIEQPLVCVVAICSVFFVFTFVNTTFCKSCQAHALKRTTPSYVERATCSIEASSKFSVFVGMSRDSVFIHPKFCSPTTIQME